MLNISENSINDFVQISYFKSFKLLRHSRIRRVSVIILLVLFVAIFLSMFLPWTQNINSKGYVTTRLPQQRPQAIQSVIGGQLEKWYVREGDFVEEGDTIAFLTEVKSDYFDPDLLNRTAEQIRAKSESVDVYDGKVRALQGQYQALLQSLQLKKQQTLNKILQARNKITMDSMDLAAYRANLQIAENQLLRTQELYDKGLKTLSELQDKKLKVQETNAKVLVQDNKLQNSKNELINLTIELSAIDNEYADKLAKSQSDQQTALSSKLESVGAVAKLESQLSNYTVRQKFYYIRAPQSGYITKTLKKGIGEILKEGTDIATIMPEIYDLAVEIYVRPQDLPLITMGTEARLRFDGWPALVISGWPESSTGLFSGEVVAIDQFIGDNGYYRILVSPLFTDKAWPENLRIGTGVQAIFLLNDVPIWYELWRQLNGFPPDFYKLEKNTGQEVKRKAPIKSVK